MTTTEVTPKAHVFNMRTPLLAQGRLDNYVAATDLLKVTVKVYAEGGENTMHMHPYEDHAFIVLQGEATFRTETDDNITVLGKNEGIMLPRRVCYWFQSSGEGNLVMIRVGAATKWPEDGRAFPDGRPFAGDSIENKEVPRIELPGQFFGD